MKMLIWSSITQLKQETRKMSDEIDAAQEQAEKIEHIYLSARMPEGPAPTGFCLCCAAPLEGKRWCDSECRDDWTHEQQMKARNRNDA